MNMESPSPVVQKIKSKKCLTEEKRTQAFKATTESIKQELIRKGYGTREDLTSQPAVLMRAAEILNGIDLKNEYPKQPRRKCEGGKMPKEEEKVVKAEREQIRRNKKNHAIHSLREFINQKGLVNKSAEGLEQLEVVDIILEHIKTLPVNNKSAAFNISSLLQKTAPGTPTLSPGLPTLSPSPPRLQQNPVVSQQLIGSLTPGLPNLLPTGSPLPLQMAPILPWMVPMDPATIQLQIQFLQNQRMLQNFFNPNKESQVKKEEDAQPAGEESTVAPIKEEDENLNLTN